MLDVLIPAVLCVIMIAFNFLRERELDKKIVPEKLPILGSATTLGTKNVQQDYFATKNLNTATLLLLADGQGENGDTAAKISVDTFRDLFNDPRAADRPQYYFKRAANAANKKITNTLEERQGETSMAAVIIDNAKFFYMLIGNSKVAVFRNGDLIPVSEGQTVDVLARHRYYEGKISKRETLALLNERRLYNVLGTDEFQDIEIFDKPIALQENDLVIVMSEGVFNTLHWREIEEALALKKFNVQEAAREIIARVNRSPHVEKENASILIYRQDA